MRRAPHLTRASAVIFGACIAFAATAQAVGQDTVSQSSDPLVCARTADGQPIEVGVDVLDRAERLIGYVSIVQCTQNPGADRMWARLGAEGGHRLQTVSLEGARLVKGRLVLRTSAEAVYTAAQAPSGG